MEKIPLRAYNREIERLIDNDRSEEALEHCQRILDNYPRCLETHRLLGKAFLELRLYDKAENTFKQVLSYVPDDFIANLGMSLLREKQTNLEGTIWHMERAFETQPTNTAIQNELRRLYKQRDGVETNRANLTRGGLIRMYMRGDMVPQALNEIQSFLEEDPSRMDIKVLQAEALLLANRKDEALEICDQILKELPYCYPVIRILFENRPSTTRIEDVESLQQQLRELDPYYEYTGPTQPDPDIVKEDEVLIEIPEGLGLKTATKQSDFNLSSMPQNTFRQATEKQIPTSLQSAGWQTENDITGEKFEEQKPSWMDTLQTPMAQSEFLAGKTSGNTPATPKPGFTSGNLMTTNDNYSPNENPTGDNNPQFSGQDDSSAPNPFLGVPGDSIPAAEPGDIPEWLKALASEPPAASSDAITAPLRVPGETGVLQTGEENLEFLRNLQGEGPAPLIPEESPTIESAPQQELLESLPGIHPDSPFVQTGETTQPVPIEDVGAPPQSTISKEMPDWMKTAAETPPVVPEKMQQPAEDLREDFISEKPAQPASFGESSALENQYQPPQPEFGEPVETAQPEVPTPEIEQYLEQLRKDTAPGEQPDWLKHENLGSDIEALFDQTAKPSEEISEPEGTPDWMAQLREENEAHPEPASSTTPMSVPNVPDWLFTSEDSGGDTAPIQSETPVTHQPPPDWLAAARPDVFAQDNLSVGSEKAESTISGDAYDESSRLDSMANLGEAPVIKSSQAEVEPTPGEKPDLSFLDSQPVDFMKVDRAPLTDNLVMPEELSEETTDTDLLKSNAPESLPADLAAMLREEAESPFTTNPLATEATPQLTPDQIPGLSQPVSFDEFRTLEPEVETPQLETTPGKEPEKEELELTPSVVFDQNEVKPIVEEIPQAKIEPSVPEEIFTEPESTSIPEIEKPVIEQPIFETTNPEDLPALDFFVSPVQEEKVEEVKKLSGDVPTIEEIIEAVTPKETAAQPLEEAVVEPVARRPIDEKTVPVSSLPPSLKEEISQSQPPTAAVEPPATPPSQTSVEPVSPPQPKVEKPPEIPPPIVVEPVISPQPVAEEPKVVLPVAKEEPAPQPPVKAEAPPPQPVAVTTQVKPIEPKPTVKVPAKEPRVTRPVKPAEAKPVRRESERPVSTPKKVGLADLNRAREFAKKGDLNAALRRYIKLINANKAIDEVSADLKELVRKNPKEYLVWQTYGDARLRDNRIQEALDAYAKAADLLK